MNLQSKALRTLIILLLSALSASLAQSKPGNSSIEQGDRLFEQMKYREAAASYALDSNTAEAQWKMARAYICYADVITSNREYYYHKAETAAKKSTVMEPMNGSAHAWLAAALGNLAMYEGSRAKVMLCNEIKRELDKAIVINPRDDIALSILGSFYHVLGNINWFERNLATLFLGGIPPGGYADSEKCFFKAIQVSPTTMRHWFELGKLYQSWGKEDKAKDAFLKAQKCPVKMASDKDRLMLAAKFLSE